tara:strand:+ start:376 stop:504 length:129 start_codon:yes stop_codon:yes gene_type:complete
MSNKDQIKLKDLEGLLDFHTQMQNKGMMSMLSAKINKLINKK